MIKKWSILHICLTYMEEIYFRDHIKSKSYKILAQLITDYII